MTKKKITIGILAHVDAGKTTLTECMLYAAGATKIAGSVDKGSAITDSMAMERERGISIKSATVDFTWKDNQVNIIDTPGHIDFSAEVDRALSVLDLTVLVVSAVEGVQAHSLNLWESLTERKIPVIIFINKIDRTGADPTQIFLDIEKDLDTCLFGLNYPDLSTPMEPKLIDFSDIDRNISSPIIENSLEHLAEVDEVFLEHYLGGNELDFTVILDTAKNAVAHNLLTPVLFGSAKLHLGIETLLDEIIRFTPVPSLGDAPLLARIFKVEFDAKLGRLAHLRLFSGTLHTKDVVLSSGHSDQLKINQIYQRKLGKFVQVKELQGGDIGAISCAEVLIAGDRLGEENSRDEFSNMLEPVLSVQAIAKEEKDYQKLGEALEILNIEDPQLELQWFKEDREYQLKILGPIQTEVLQDSLSKRFGIEANFLPPKVIYQETPKSTAEGYVRYWMPKPCWAIMTFLIEPGAQGSGVVFESKVRTSDISAKYQNEVKRAIPWSLRQGIKGWEVTDIKITLIEGSEHQVHSNPGDFLLATPMGIMRGLEAAGTELLEPIYSFLIKAQADLLGPIASDLNQMNATLGTPIFDGDTFTLTGRVSVEQAMNYGIKFNATTSGKGRLKLTLDGYQPTTSSAEKIRAYRGVSPLEESLWILHNRGAFKAEDRRR